MANEYGNISYGDDSRREDLTDVIANISPTDTPFTSMLPYSEKVNNTYHEWQEDALAARAANAQYEGASASYSAATNPTRLSNVTQILLKSTNISGTQRAILHAGYKDQLAYQKAKLTKEFKNDLEYNVITSSLDTGASATARDMRGALEFAGTLTSAVGASAALDETILKNYLEYGWENGADIDKIFVGGHLKRKISDMTAGNTKNIQAEAGKIVNLVTVYEGDFGVQQVLKCRDLNSSGASTATMLMVQSDLWAFGWLRRPTSQVVEGEGIGSDRDGIIVRGEGTLVCKCPKGNVKVTGLNVSL